jgi:hypothetical protein
MYIIFLLGIASFWLLLLMPFQASDVDRPIATGDGNQLIGRPLGDLEDRDFETCPRPTLPIHLFTLPVRELGNVAIFEESQ